MVLGVEDVVCLLLIWHEKGYDGAMAKLEEEAVVGKYSRISTSLLSLLEVRSDLANADERGLLDEKRH